MRFSSSSFSSVAILRLLAAVVLVAAFHGHLARLSLAVPLLQAPESNEYNRALARFSTNVQRLYDHNTQLTWRAVTQPRATYARLRRKVGEWAAPAADVPSLQPNDRRSHNKNNKNNKNVNSIGQDPVSTGLRVASGAAKWWLAEHRDVLGASNDLGAAFLRTSAGKIASLRTRLPQAIAKASNVVSELLSVQPAKAADVEKAIYMNRISRRME